MRVKLLFLVLLLLIISCKQKGKDLPPRADLAINIDDTEALMQNRVYVKYKIPLPYDLFNFLSEKGIFDQRILTPLEIKNDLLNEKHKALALGILNADLAYCSVLQNAQKALEYFEVSKAIAQDLSIESGYSEQIFERLNNNLNNYDSIRKITDEAYWKACNFLEENNRYNILPFVVVGGWFESMYLIIESKNDKIDPTEVKKVLLNQQQGFKNTMNFLYDAQLESSAYHYYQDLRKVIDKIKTILEIYEKYYVVPTAQKPEVYKQLEQSIIDYRNSLLKGQI